MEKKIEEIREIQEQEFTAMEDGGFVYLLESGGRYKIGETTTPAKRILQLKTSSPFVVRVLMCRYFFKRMEVEKLLHSYFTVKRVKGEWFALEDKELNEAVSLLRLGWYFEPQTEDMGGLETDEYIGRDEVERRGKYYV
jgi:hypothetical protein